MRSGCLPRVDYVQIHPFHLRGEGGGALIFRTPARRHLFGRGAGDEARYF